MQWLIQCNTIYKKHVKLFVLSSLQNYVNVQNKFVTSKFFIKYKSILLKLVMHYFNSAINSH